MSEKIEISIPYGTGVLKATVPAGNYIGMASPYEPLSPVSCEVEEVKRALAHPIESPPLSHIVQANDKIAIIVSDHTRSNAIWPDLGTGTGRIT